MRQIEVDSRNCETEYSLKAPVELTLLSDHTSNSTQRFAIKIGEKEIAEIENQRYGK